MLVCLTSLQAKNYDDIDDCKGDIDNGPPHQPTLMILCAPLLAGWTVLGMAPLDQVSTEDIGLYCIDNPGVLFLPG